MTTTTNNDILAIDDLFGSIGQASITQAAEVEKPMPGFSADLPTEMSTPDRKDATPAPDELFLYRLDRITLETLAAVGLHFVERAMNEADVASEILDAVGPTLIGKPYHQRLLRHYGTAHGENKKLA